LPIIVTTAPFRVGLRTCFAFGKPHVTDVVDHNSETSTRPPTPTPTPTTTPTPTPTRARKHTQVHACSHAHTRTRVHARTATILNVAASHWTQLTLRGSPKQGCTFIRQLTGRSQKLTRITELQNLHANSIENAFGQLSIFPKYLRLRSTIFTEGYQGARLR
jgi:hypothetical protein